MPPLLVSLVFGMGPLLHTQIFLNKQKVQAQRWMICLILANGLINSGASDKAFTPISKYNDKVSNKYTQGYSKPRYHSYGLA